MTLLLLLSACFVFRRDRKGELDLALEAADEVFAQRTDAEKLDEAIGAYVLINATWPAEGRVLVRLSRSFAARAETLGPEDQRKELELARGYGLECLANNPGFSSRWNLAGGRVTPEAVRQLTATDAPCIAETLYSWLRWAEGRGPAAAVDLPALKALSERARELPTGWVGPWSSGMVVLLQPGPVPRDLVASRQDLQEAILLAPDRATAHADLVRWQLVLEGDGAAFDREVDGFPKNWPKASDGAWALENRVARERVQALQGRGDELMRQAWVQSNERAP